MSWGTQALNASPMMDTRVAVKEFDLEALKVSSHQQQFLKDVQVLARLTHPNIVKFVGASTKYEDATNAPPFIVFELLHCTLYHALFVQQPCPLQDCGVTMRIACEVADALQYLHAQRPRIVHHDVKPENVMLADSLQAKLIDFGLTATVDSITIGAASHPSNHTYTEHMPRTGLPHISSMAIYGRGTLGYVPPEIMAGNGTLGMHLELTEQHKVDVYAFGVLLWQLACKQDPYVDMNEQDIAQAVNSGKPLPDCGAAISVRLQQLLDGCCARDPSQRQEMSEVLVLLQACAASDFACDLAPAHPADVIRVLSIDSRNSEVCQILIMLIFDGP